MRRWVRYSLLIVLVGFYIAIGYLRDFIFVNINFALKKLRSDEAFGGHSFMEFLKGYDPGTLYASKFFFTGLFTVLNFLPGALVLYLLFQEKRFLRWYGLLYLSVILLALFFYGGGYLFGDPAQGYSLARLFMGFLQSPLPTMLFIPLLMLYRNEHRSGS